MGLALQALALCGAHALIRGSLTPPEGTAALQASVALGAAPDALVSADYRKKVDKASAEIMSGFLRGNLLMQYYVAQWQQTSESPTAFFIAVDFNMIVEGSAREGKLVPLGMFLDLWDQLDWNRKHFLVLQQCSPEQLEHYAQKLKPDFQLLHPNLTVFDSRLTNLKLATRHPALQAWQLRRVGLEPATAWATKHMVPIPLFHGDDPHGKQLELLGNCSGSVKSGAYFAGSITHGPRPEGGYQEAVSARKAIYSVVTNDKVLKRRVKVDAYRVNDTVQEVPFTEFAQSLCEASYALVGSGTFTPSFMTAEAIHAGTLPIFVVGNGTCCRPEGLPMARAAMLFARDYDSLLPFYDEGVRFSRFGEIVPVGALNAPLLRQLIDSKEDSLVAKRQALKHVAPRFTPEGTWQYILRRMHMPGASSLSSPADTLETKGDLKARSAEPQPDGDSDVRPPSALHDGVDSAVASVWHDVATRRYAREKPTKSRQRVASEDFDTSKEPQAQSAEMRHIPTVTEPSNGGKPAAHDAWNYTRGPHARVATCTRCGTNTAQPCVELHCRPNCCSDGGSWENMCNEGGQHTWHEGFQSCSMLTKGSVTPKEPTQWKAVYLAQKTRVDAATRLR